MQYLHISKYQNGLRSSTIRSSNVQLQWIIITNLDALFIAFFDCGDIEGCSPGSWWTTWGHIWLGQVGEGYVVGNVGLVALLVPWIWYTSYHTTGGEWDDPNQPKIQMMFFMSGIFSSERQWGSFLNQTAVCTDSHASITSWFWTDVWFCSLQMASDFTPMSNPTSITTYHTPFPMLLQTCLPEGTIKRKS